VNPELASATQVNPSDRIVLVAVPRPLRPWTRYEDQIFADIPDDFEVRFVGGTTSLEDVALIHASGSLDRMMGVTEGDGTRERLAKTRDFVRLLSKYDVQLVRTIHVPCESFEDDMQREASRLLDAHTALFIAVDSGALPASEHASRVIPYADMTERFIGYPTRDMEAGRIAALAPVGQDDVAQSLARTIGFTRTSGLSLRIAGEATSQLENALGEVALERNTSWRRENLSDAAYIEEITNAELVFPPDPRTLYGYHLMMLSLSFARPVAVPSCAITNSLANELGPEWIVNYDGQITASIIDFAVNRVGPIRGRSAPSMPERRLAEVSRQYFATFRDVVRCKKYPRRDS